MNLLGLCQIIPVLRIVQDKFHSLAYRMGSTLSAKHLSAKSLVGGIFIKVHKDDRQRFCTF